MTKNSITTKTNFLNVFENMEDDEIIEIVDDEEEKDE